MNFLDTIDDLEWTDGDEAEFWQLMRKMGYPDPDPWSTTAHYKGHNSPDPNALSIHDVSDIKEQIRDASGRVKTAEHFVVLPLDDVMDDAASQLDPEINSMRQGYSFFLLRYYLHAEPKAKEQLTRLVVRLTYADDSIQTWALWPSTAVERTKIAEAKLKLGVNFSLGLEIPVVALIPGAPVGAGFRTDANGEVLIYRTWERITARVAASGRQSGYARWLLTDPEDLWGDIEFHVLIAAPKGTRKAVINVDGEYKVTRPWWHDLGPRFRSPEPITVPLPLP